MINQNQALQNLMNIEKKIIQICESNNRTKDSCRLLPVTKTVSFEILEHLIKNNYNLFAENKVQEMKSKALKLFDYNPKWHFIGHLQSNKVKASLEYIEMLHSLDRLSLAKSLDTELAKQGRTLDVLVQVNTSGEASKFGCLPEETLHLVTKIAGIKNLKIKGLMTLALFSGEENKVRKCFKILKQLSDDIRTKKLPNVEMKELSMGMSSDYQIAIEEGATIIRIGQDIFGPRPTKDSEYWNEDKK